MKKVYIKVKYYVGILMVAITTYSKSILFVARATILVISEPHRCFGLST